MNFILFVAAIYCFLSSGDVAYHVNANHEKQLPPSTTVRFTYFVFMAPAALGVIGLPIYGFFVLPWWQPLVAVLIGSILGNVITRRKLAGSGWLYAWAMCFSAIGLCFALAFLITR